jgi:hypothetical protein
MKPMLDDLELPLVQEITTHDRRTLAEHKPPGMEGSLLQNLGRRPERLVLWGIAAGDEAQETIEKLDEKFRAGGPFPFAADISVDSEIEQIVIDDFQVQEIAGKPQRFAFTLSMREFIEPVEPEDLSVLEDAIALEAGDLVGDLLGGLDIGLDFASGLERFATSMGGLLERLQQFKRDIESANG